MWKNSQIFYHIFKPNNEIDIQFFSIECHIAYDNHSRNYWPTATLWRFHFDQRVIKICLIFFWCFEVLWLEFMVTQRTNFVKLELFFLLWEFTESFSMSLMCVVKFGAEWNLTSGKSLLRNVKLRLQSSSARNQEQKKSAKRIHFSIFNPD